MNSSRPWGIFFAAACALVACSSEGGTGGEKLKAANGTACTAAAECASAVCSTSDKKCGYGDGTGVCDATTASTVCRSGTCSANAKTCIPAGPGRCAADADCGAGKACNKGTLTCEAASTKSAPGGACASDDDCQGPSPTCLTDYPGGYCIRSCTVASPCPTGATCLDTGDGGICASSCTKDADCRVAEGYYCDTASGTCESALYIPVNPGAAAIGAACASDDACESGICFVETTEDGVATGYAGGYCSAECIVGREGSCPEGATCVGGACRKSCSSAADCRGAPYACVEGACKLDPSLVAVGNACAAAADCADAAICLTEEDTSGTFPGGMCVLADDCDPAANTGCGAGKRCVNVFEATETGELASLAVCLPSCTTAADCRDGYACEPTTSTCQRARVTDVSKVRLGAACNSNADCDVEAGAGGICLTGDQFPRGYCTAPGCSNGGSPGDDQDSCTSAGGSCWVLSAVGIQLHCIKSCAQTSECRGTDGYTCDDDSTCWYYPPE